MQSIMVWMWKKEFEYGDIACAEFRDWIFDMCLISVHGMLMLILIQFIYVI